MSDRLSPALRVAILGGGPAGLATLKYLVTAGDLHFPGLPAVVVRLFEAEPTIGGTLRYRVYEDAEMVSSKYLTTFSDFRLPSDTPDFPSPETYAAYLDAYADAWRLQPHIECGKRVLSLQRVAGGGHNVSVQSVADGSKEMWECDAVAICCGVNSVPTVLDPIPGLESEMGSFNSATGTGAEKKVKVLHSSQFKGRADFGPQYGEGKTVVVVGAGETGLDIAHLAVTGNVKEVVVCHRAGFTTAPKIVPEPVIMRSYGLPDPKKPRRPNIPIDTSIASLFDTAYCHPRLQRSALPWIAYDEFIKKMFWVISGTQGGIDQWAGTVEKDYCVDSLFFVKSTRALAYISGPHRSKSLPNRIRSFLINVPIRETPPDRIIKVATWPKVYDRSTGTLYFEDTDRPEARLLRAQGQRTGGGSVKPDVLVLASGYQQTFPFLPSDGTYKTPREIDTHCVYDSTDLSVGYIGLVRPSVGAIPPLAELQAMVWLHRLLRSRYPEAVPPISGPDSLPTYALDYRLRRRGKRDMATLKYGVDHESYAYQMGVEAGAAPNIAWVLRNGWFKLAFVWAMGPNFNSKFRLVGPWKWKGKPSNVSDAAMDSRGMIVSPEEVMKGELWDVVKRTGGFVFIFWYTVVPFFLFAFLTLLYHIWDLVVAGIGTARDFFSPPGETNTTTRKPRAHNSHQDSQDS